MAQLHLNGDENVQHIACSIDDLLLDLQLENQKDYFIMPHINGNDVDPLPPLNTP